MERRPTRRTQGRGDPFAHGRGSDPRPIRRSSVDVDRFDRSRWEPESEINLGTITGFMRDHWMLLTIVLVGISLRIMFLNQESVWIDEALTGWRASGIFIEMWHEVTGGDQMPFYFLVIWFVARTFGDSILVLRGLSVLFGVLAFIPVYRIGRRFSREIALIALLLFAISPTMIFYSQEARMYMLMVMLSGFSIMYHLEYLDPNIENKRSLGLKMVILDVCLIYVHYFGVLFVGIQLLSLFATLLFRSIRDKEGFRIKENSIRCWPQMISLIMWIPWLIFQQTEHTVVDKKTGGSLGLGWDLIPETYRFIGGQYTAILATDTEIALYVGYFFMILFFVSIVSLLLKIRKDHHTIPLILFGLILILISPIIIHFVSNNYTPMYNHRYFIFFSIPFFIIISMAVGGIMKVMKERGLPLIPLTTMIIAILVIPSLIGDLDQLQRDDKADWKAGVDLILKNQNPEDIVIPFPDYEQMIIFYYTDDINVKVLNRIDNRSKFIEDHFRVWVMFNVIEDMDRFPLIQALNQWEMEEFQRGEIIIRLYKKQYLLESEDPTEDQ